MASFTRIRGRGSRSRTIYFKGKYTTAEKCTPRQRNVMRRAGDEDMLGGVSALEEYEKLAGATKMGKSVKGGGEAAKSGLDALREGLFARVEGGDKGESAGVDVDAIRARVSEQIDMMKGAGKTLDVEGLQTRVDETLSSVKGALDASTEQISKTLSSSVESITSSISVPSAPSVPSSLPSPDELAATVASFSSTVLDQLVSAISESLEERWQLTQFVGNAIEPLVSSIAPSLEPITSSVVATLEPLTSAVTTAVEPLAVYLEPLTSAVEPYADTLRASPSTTIAAVAGLVLSSKVYRIVTTTSALPFAPIFMGYNGVLNAKRASSILTDTRQGGGAVLLIDTRPEREIALNGALDIAVNGLQISSEAVRSKVKSRMFPTQGNASDLDAKILSCVIADLKSLERFEQIVVLDSKGSAFAKKLATNLYARRLRRKTKVFTVKKGFAAMRKVMDIEYDTPYVFERTLIGDIGQNLLKLGSGTPSAGGDKDDGSAGIFDGIFEDRAAVAKAAAVSACAVVAVVQWKLVLEIIGICGLTVTGFQQLRLGEFFEKIKESRSRRTSDDDEKTSIENLL